MTRTATRWGLGATGAVGLMLAVAGCPSRAPQQTGLGSGGTGGGSSTGGSAATPEGVAQCEVIRSKVEGLYRADAQATKPQRVDEATADNTAMVLGECARDAAHIVPCVQRQATIRDLETKCLAPLDEEGTEGEALRK